MKIFQHITKSGKKSPYWIVDLGVEKIKVVGKKMAEKLFDLYSRNIEVSTDGNSQHGSRTDKRSRNSESIRTFSWLLLGIQIPKTDSSNHNGTIVVGTVNDNKIARTDSGISINNLSKISGTNILHGTVTGAKLSRSNKCPDEKNQELHPDFARIIHSISVTSDRVSKLTDEAYENVVEFWKDALKGACDKWGETIEYWGETIQLWGETITDWGTTIELLQDYGNRLDYIYEITVEFEEKLRSNFGIYLEDTDAGFEFPFRRPTGNDSKTSNLDNESGNTIRTIFQV